MPVASWFDDINDTELMDLIPFLENLSTADDVLAYLRTANMSSYRVHCNSQIINSVPITDANSNS